MDKLQKVKLEFQNYEIQNILWGLELAIKEIQKNCKWEMQPSGQYYYTDNNQVKRLRFTVNSIKRQLAKNGEML